MNDLALQLLSIFRQQVSVHASRSKIEAERIRCAVDAQDWLRLRYLLREMTADPFPEYDPAYSYPKALILWGLGNREESLMWLDNATRYYTAHGQDDVAALCQIESADIYQERGEFLSALHALDRASLYIKHAQSPQPRIRARLHLLESVLTTDTGRLTDGFPLAQMAQSMFHTEGDANSEFLALMQLANLCLFQADFRKARSYLQLARYCYTSGPVLARYEVRLGNSTTHLSWYMGDLESGLAECKRLQHLCKRREQTIQLIYAHLLEGNLLRALRQLEPAERAYETALDLCAEHNRPPLQRWIWANRSWLCLLDGRVDEARHLLEQASYGADTAEQMSLQVNAAVVSLLAGHTSAAERALHVSREYYQWAGDALSVCAIDFHLTNLHLQMDHRASASRRLKEALDWMAKHGIDYFPHWWHTATIYSVLSFGEQVAPQHTELIQRIMRKRIGVDPLSPLPNQQSQVFSQENRFEELLQAVDSTIIRAVLRDLLINGKLRAVGFLTICRTLSDAGTETSRSYLLCAIFGLYIHGMPRKEIASEVQESEGVIRHVIRHIYERMAPHLLDVPKTSVRRQRLHAEAKVAGWIDGDDSGLF